MGTGQSKSSPDVQMRLRMENGFDEDEDSSITALGISGRKDPTRSQSNVSRHPSERLGTEEDEYFNRIYNKRVEKSLVSVNGGSVKSAPVGNKKEKDPEVAAAIAELEETFKVLGDAPLKSAENENGSDLKAETNLEQNDKNGPPHIIDIGLPANDGREMNRFDLQSSHESPASSSSYSSSESANFNQQADSRIGEANFSEMNRRPSKFLEINRTRLDSSGNSYPTHSGSSSSATSQANMSVSRGGAKQRFLISSYAKQGKNNSLQHNSQSLLIQQRKEFQSQRRNGNENNKNILSNREIIKQEREQDWTYQAPKINGFDVDKFKEINSKVAPAAIVILREEEDRGYYSQSSEPPSYTKDELDLIASLEREAY